MLVKTMPARVKAVGDGDGLAEGEFEAIVSVFGNIDSYGDVVMPGAFADDLKDWAASGNPLPVIWSHDWSDPFSHLGSVLKAEEREEGLWVRARIEDLDSNPKALQVYRLLKGRRVTQFSFAYDVLDGAMGERDDRQVYELRKMHVHEVGPCLVGANRDTDLLAVKARQLEANAKAGVGIRAVDLTSLRTAKAALDAALTAAEAAVEPDPIPAPDVDPEPDVAPPVEPAPGEPTTDPLPDPEEVSDAPAPDGTTAETGQQPDATASTEPDGAPPAKSAPVPSAQAFGEWDQIARLTQTP